MQDFEVPRDTKAVMQLADLQERMAIVQAAIERNAEQSRRTPTGQTSKFWAELFGMRSIYPDLNALMVCRREGNTLGVGDVPQGSFERERAYADRMHYIFRNMVSQDFVRRLPESSFGSPLVFEHDGMARSANFWINAATTSRVVDFAKKFGMNGPLRVLEIGPGWGACVYQLHNVIDIESYTLVDLPENLYISTLHLGTVLPDRRIKFIDVEGQKVKEIARGTISACLPGAIHRIEAQFDLVVNSFSMQEMDIESVRAYIDWIEAVLSPEGIFVSLNSHAKAGAEKPSDYRYEKFHIHQWGVFRSVPSAFYNTIPYEVVLGRKRAQSPLYPVNCQDGLGRLMQFGLDKDISALSEALVRGNLDSHQINILTAYNELFVSGDDAQRLDRLEKLKSLDASPVWLFIAGLFFLVRGDRQQASSLLDQALKGGLGGFAGMRAGIFLAGLNTKSSELRKAASAGEFDPTFAYPEADLIIKSGDLDHAIVHINRAFGRSI